MPPKIRTPLFKDKNTSKRKHPPSPRDTDTSAGSHAKSSSSFGRPIKRRRSHNTLLSSTPIKASGHIDSPAAEVCLSEINSNLASDDKLSSLNKNGQSAEVSAKVEESTEEMLDDILFGTESVVPESDGVDTSMSSRKASQIGTPSPNIASTKKKQSGVNYEIPDVDDGDLNDDILCGLCPEDLSFSFYNSSVLEYAGSSETKFDPVSSNVLTSPSEDLSSVTSYTTVNHTAVNEESEVSKDLQEPMDFTSFQGAGFVKSSELLHSKLTVQSPLTGANSKVETFYGLPVKVKEYFEEYRGIKQLYEWQHRCLSMPSVNNGGNLIYSLPTSGGKTLVAEILILKQLLLNNKDALLILPFVSIVQEKVRQLTSFSIVLGFAVEEFAASKGRLPPRQRRKKRVLYIATIEKANGLVNSLMELGRVHNLGLVVVDELHMLGDGSCRGATLESCLAKLQHCSPHTQLVGMSATLGNMAEVAAFLRAQVFSSDFRPVDLVEHVKLGKCVYRIMIGNAVNFDPVRDVSDSTHSGLDPDHLSCLVEEVVPHSSCLIFCPTKKSCQNVALLLTKTLPRSLRGVNQSGKQQLIRTLSLEASGVCPTLAQTIPYGVAYHHSGLTADERRVIEEGYLEGALCVIACTSTLAAGVNLPAKRVILRSPYIGSQLMTRSQYKQMVGRAGRSGLCDTGDSILILSQRDKNQVVSMLGGPYEVCKSSLLSDDGATLHSLVLNIIGLKVVESFSDIQHFFSSTLLCAQLDNIDEQIQDALAKLVTMGYITMETGDDPNYQITALGRATFKGCLPVDLAHIAYKELKDNLQTLVLSTDLHLLYLATPISLSPSIQPNWMVYFQEVTSLGEDELRTAELLGIKPGYLVGRATGSGKGSLSADMQQLYHRFYITLILHSLLKLTSFEALWRVANRFHCSRGFLQSVMNTTASHASCLVMFTAELPVLWPLHLLLPAITKKLAYSAHLELVPLMEVPGVKQGRARQLVAAGITTQLQLASTDPNKLVECVDNLFPKQAKRLVQAAKALLAEQAEALMEEAEELMSLAPGPPPT